MTNIFSLCVSHQNDIIFNHLYYVLVWEITQFMSHKSANVQVIILHAFKNTKSHKIIILFYKNTRNTFSSRHLIVFNANWERILIS